MYYVQAEDQRDRDNWFKAIETAKKQLSLYDADDDTSSVDRDKEYAKEVINSYKLSHAVSIQQRRRSSGGTGEDRPGRASAESGDRGAAASQVSPVDIPKSNRGMGGLSSTPLSDSSNDHSFPLSPNSDHLAQIHMAEGLASSEDDEDYGVHHGQAAKGQDKVVIKGYLYKLGRNKASRKDFERGAVAYLGQLGMEQTLVCAGNQYTGLLRRRKGTYCDMEHTKADLSQKDKPHRIIPLSHIMDSYYVGPLSKKRLFCFKVIIPKRNYVLCANTEPQMEDWLNAFTVAVPRAKKDSDAKLDGKPISHDLPHRPLSLIPENAGSSQQLQRLSSASTTESFENASHLSGVSGAGGVGGAGGALGELPTTSDLARIHSRASERLGRAI